MNMESLTFRKKLAIVAFALYVTFILLSAVPYLAESHMRVTQAMDSKYQYDLEFDADGEQSHYDVERVNTNSPGTIEITYSTASHTVGVKTTNINRLVIDCQSVYEDESMKVFKEDPMDSYHKDYFKDHEKHLTVNVFTDNELTLRFKNAPVPIEVWVDETEWWKTKTNYFMDDQDIVVSHIPKGDTLIELYFSSPKEISEDDESEDEDGMFGMGKIWKIDVFLLLILIFILIIIVSTAGYLSWVKIAEERAEKKEEAKYLKKIERIQKKKNRGRKKK